ncbi:MAG: Zn-dependent M16 (insulinase) family peptidase [Patiriisocius sp.]|jgi:Zn-dependent M16 (insulinase) family peptidase
MSNNPSHHESFTFIRSHHIPNLDLSVQEFNHIKTGAVHYHLDVKHLENVFLVAFRTVPTDSTGVAHILEHTTLCGSEKYPVRDPFFLMIRRSLNTFMNAFTASDYTAYPFASENKQDFNNLLDIYLDAVFFPLLDPMDFAQEGHRIEFEVPDDPTSKLIYKGIVYNEMKGDQSSAVSQLYEAIKAELFPTSTYHHNSGGDPEEIIGLSYEDLTKFHRTHYHPTNAIFMTFGDIPAVAHQTNFEQKALKKFSASADHVEVLAEISLTETSRVEQPYASSEGDTSKQCHVVMGWKLGPNTDLEALIKCNLLSDVLLDTSASPLRLALENTPLAAAPSPLCGLEETNFEMSFFCGVEGTEREDADKIEELILNSLVSVASDGVSVDRIEACLHQIELSHREIGGDGYPYGLQLMFSCLAATIHRSDPIGLLDLDPVLTKLRSEISNPDFIPDLVRSCLLENPHRVRLTLYPDSELVTQRDAATEQKLATFKSTLSATDIETMMTEAKALDARQNRVEPVDILPKVGLGDISPRRVSTQATQTLLPNGMPLTHYKTGTNGIVYEQQIADLPDLPSDLRQHLQIYSQVITEIGSENRDYLETQHLQHSLTGGLGCYSSIRGGINNPNDLHGKFVLSSRSLATNLSAMNQLLVDTCFTPGLHERNRIRDLVNQLRVRREASIVNNGHGLAMTAAAAYFRPVPALNHGLSGLAGTVWLKGLDQDIDDDDHLDRLLSNLLGVKDALSNSARQLLIISEGDLSNTESLASAWGQSKLGSSAAEITSPELSVPQNQAWITTTEVNFCAEVFATVPESHPDSAPLSVLGGVLRNGFLHRAVREQGGAYGGGATHDGANGLFRFYSYRDPNLEKTFDAFQEAIRWVRTGDIHFDLIEEAILGIVSSIDAPGSPAGEARQSFHQSLFGRTAEHRDNIRRQIIETTVEDVKRVAELYLISESSKAVVTHNRAKLVNSFQVNQI